MWHLGEEPVDGSGMPADAGIPLLTFQPPEGLYVLHQAWELCHSRKLHDVPSMVTASGLHSMSVWQELEVSGGMAFCKAACLAQPMSASVAMSAQLAVVYQHRHTHRMPKPSSDAESLSP